MADPRLQWRQLNQAQPNVAGLMRGSNDSLMAAGEAAKGILASYQEGAESKAHNELLRRTGGKSQDEITAMYQAGAFDDLNLGERGLTDLRDTMTRRSNIDNTNATSRNTDARTRQTDTRTGIMSDQHGIVMREDGRMVRQRDWQEDNAGAFLDSRLGGLNEGSAFSRSMGAESGGGEDQYDAILGHAQRENGVRVSQMTLGELSDFSQGEYAQYSRDWKAQNNHGDASVPSTPMGKYQIVGQTLRGIVNTFDLPPDVRFTPAVQDEMGTYLAQQRIASAGSPAEARAGLRSEWEAYRNMDDATLDAVIADISARPPVTRDSILAASQGGGQQQQPQQNPLTAPTNRGFGGDAYAASMAASGMFTPAEILAQQSPLEAAAARGDELNETDRQNAITDQALLIAEDLVQDPNITEENFVKMARDEMLQTPGLDMNEREVFALEQKLAEIYSSSQLLQEELSPGQTTADQLIAQTQQADQQTDIALANRAVGGTPEAQFQTDAESFAGVPNSAEKSAMLLEQFRLRDPDFENNPIFGRDADFDPATMDQHMQKAQRELRKVDPDITIDEVYALASRVFQADPWGRNTLDKQVDIDAMVETLGGFSSTGGREFAEARNNIQRVDREMTANANSIQQIESQLRRPAVQNDPEMKRRYESDLEKLRAARSDLAGELRQYTEVVDRADAEEAAAALSQAPTTRGAAVRRQ